MFIMIQKALARTNSMFFSGNDDMYLRVNYFNFQLYSSTWSGPDAVDFSSYWSFLEQEGQKEMIEDYSSFWTLEAEEINTGHLRCIFH
jgi:hypothetical protein